MHSLVLRRVDAASRPAPYRALLGRARRRLAFLSPPLAAAALTAAALLLPATDGETAQTQINDVKLSATHISYAAAGNRPAARE